MLSRSGTQLLAGILIAAVSPLLHAQIMLSGRDWAAFEYRH
jgi:hypothetical protein